MGKRLLGLLVVSLVAVLAFGASTASAHFWAANTQIGVDDFVANGTVHVDGFLISERARCENFRFVTLWAFEESTNPDRPTFIDSDVSDPGGQYVLEGDVPEGTDYFQIRVRRQNVGSEGHRHICRGASATLVEV